MKKTIQFAVIIILAFLILISVLTYGLLYFNQFHKNLRAITDSEKQVVMEVLNNNGIPEGYDIIFGKVYLARDKEIAQVTIIEGKSKKDYFIDLTQREMVKK